MLKTADLRLTKFIRRLKDLNSCTAAAMPSSVQASWPADMMTRLVIISLFILLAELKTEAPTVITKDSVNCEVRREKEFKKFDQKDFKKVVAIV